MHPVFFCRRRNVPRHILYAFVVKLLTALLKSCAHWSGSVPDAAFSCAAATFCFTTCESCCARSLICSIKDFCSPTKLCISSILSLKCLDAEILELSFSAVASVSSLPVDTACFVSTTSSPICLLASLHAFASLLISPATTANPLPASPALAASIEAFSDNRFVC